MRAALAAVRAETRAPVAAVIYSHFHYVGGTAAIEEEQPLDGVPIWGHERIPANLARATQEVGPAYARGLVHQFGLALPAEGPDGLVNVGLGRSFRNPDHAPFTPGHRDPDHTFAQPVETEVAGLPVVLTPAPSDADDSITIWFPTLGLCVNNLVWPTLFNVYAIRGERYRDPQVVVAGIDHILGLAPDHLVGTHGPPLSGADEIRTQATLARDAIQFLWDQTVRGLNRGLTATELIEAVQLPEVYRSTPLTQQLYGLAEHHVRQIQAGLVGWFDGTEAELFPLPTAERCRRLIAGFGGREAVAAQAQQALDGGDVRWALELATWLVRSETGDDGRADGGTADERALLASVLRTIGQRTTSANLRNWTLTRARELEGSVDLARHRRHRFSSVEVELGDPAAFLGRLRVVVVPERTTGIDDELAIRLADGPIVGLRVRHGVVVVTDGASASVTVDIDRSTLADVLAAGTTLGQALDAGRATVTGDRSTLAVLTSCFDHAGLVV